MNSPRLCATIMTSCIAIALGVWSSADAFHDGGVAACNGCHVMHNLEDGHEVVVGGAGDYLLRAATSSDLCLSCHASDLGAVLGFSPLSPPPEMGGGNFVFLLEDNLNDAPDGAVNPINGDAAGHNVNAPAHGLAADGTVAFSPGGSYPSHSLGCTSCHDPHGNENFRMLRDAGSGQIWETSFAYAAPTAVGLDIEAAFSETNASHTAYQAGMSRWCGNCHEDYLTRHNRTQSGFSHRVDNALGGSASDYYSQYNGTDDPNGGVPATAYLAAVPFEDNTVTTTSTRGPANNSRMNCLSCHRAHASSGPRSGRWDFNVSLLAADGVASGSYPIPDPYSSPRQLPLCQKCHDRVP